MSVPWSGCNVYLLPQSFKRLWARGRKETPTQRRKIGRATHALLNSRGLSYLRNNSISSQKILQLRAARIRNNCTNSLTHSPSATCPSRTDTKRKFRRIYIRLSCPLSPPPPAADRWSFSFWPENLMSIVFFWWSPWPSPTVASRTMMWSSSGSVQFGNRGIRRRLRRRLRTFTIVAMALAAETERRRIIRNLRRRPRRCRLWRSRCCLLGVGSGLILTIVCSFHVSFVVWSLYFWFFRFVNWIRRSRCYWIAVFNSNRN